MSLNHREAFKVGVLARCAAEGLSITETRAVVKRGMDKLAVLSTLLGKAMDLGRGVTTTTMGWGIPAMLAAPPILGGLAGYGLARATDMDDTDVDEIKDREVLDEYQRQTEQLRHQRAARDYRKARASGGRTF